MGCTQVHRPGLPITFSKSPRASVQIHQRHPTSLSSIRAQNKILPLSRPESSAGVERGDLPRLRDLRVVGQIGSGYILVDKPLAAWIVDQHVAHERALLDRLTDPEDGQMPTIRHY